jgi:polysaccharide pyruvyl transferase WcaK-like protein
MTMPVPAERPARGSITGPKSAVEILGPWLPNKGDELMLRAVVAQLQGRFVLAAADQMGRSRLARKLGLRRLWRSATKHEIALARSGARRAVIRARSILAHLPISCQKRLGGVGSRQLNALLDCSGFAYGDAWSPYRLERRTAYYESLRQQGTRLIMLPQALGPFEKPEVRAAARRMLQLFDLVVARDATSAGYVADLDLREVRQLTCPDLTHLLAGAPIAQRELWARRVALVPNARMLDKTPADVRALYLDSFVYVARVLKSRGLEPCLFLHEANDHLVAEQLRGQVDFPLPVHDESALATKGMLGACHSVVSSRYHATVSALSQGVPVLGTMWTHKYAALFDEYDCSECILRPETGPSAWDATLNILLDDEQHQQLRARLAARARVQRNQVETMWTVVESLIAGGAHE